MKYQYEKMYKNSSMIRRICDRLIVSNDGFEQRREPFYGIRKIIIQISITTLLFIYIFPGMLYAQFIPQELTGNIAELPDTTRLKEKSIIFSDFDKLVEKRLSGIDEMAELAKMDAESKKVEGLLKSMNSAHDRMLMEALKNRKSFESMISEMKENDFMGEVQEKLKSAKDRLDRLKKKYSYLPSDTRPSDGMKRNSLRDESFIRRLAPGGYFNFLTSEPITIDFSPEVGYELNRNFRAGVKAEMRVTLGRQGITNFLIPEKMAGFGFYCSHKIILGIIARVEYESLYAEKMNADNQIITSHSNGLLAGIGKEFRIRKGISGSVFFYYNTLHSDQSPRPGPWQVKFGINMR
ncbi:MAG TPA: hypothetical protein VI583_01495 [Cyclobacteriaceae bacterium]|nr:hypothetical protein [Cyclobacteriaceae bacterium]